MQVKLLERIEQTRRLMIRSAAKHGITHEVTLKYSQELDDWLNYYYKVNQRDK